MCFSKTSKWRKIQCGRPYQFFGKVVEFDPQNVYTKFRVNQTYGVGIMNFKVKKLFFFIVPPSGRLWSNYLGSICTQLPNKGTKFHVSTIYHLTGICENVSEEKE